MRFPIVLVTLLVAVQVAYECGADPFKEKIDFKSIKLRSVDGAKRKLSPFEEKIDFSQIKLRKVEPAGASPIQLTGDSGDGDDGSLSSRVSSLWNIKLKPVGESEQRETATQKSVQLMSDDGDNALPAGGHELMADDLAASIEEPASSTVMEAGGEAANQAEATKEDQPEVRVAEESRPRIEVAEEDQPEAKAADEPEVEAPEANDTDSQLSEEPSVEGERKLAADPSWDLF